MKPHKGTINNWSIQRVGRMGLRVVIGVPINHPDFQGWIRTSYIVKQEGNEVETANSRYTLGTPA